MIFLSDLCAIKPGHPFRGAIRPRPDGEALVVQMRDIGAAADIDWSGVIRTALPGRKTPDWLADGDILLPSVGDALRPAHVTRPPNDAVCSPHLHLLKPDQSRIRPGFLVWLLTQPAVRNQLARRMAGSAVKSITRASLSSLALPVPGLETQDDILAFAGAARQERDALNALITLREREMSALARHLFNDSLTTGAPS